MKHKSKHSSGIFDPHKASAMRSGHAEGELAMAKKGAAHSAPSHKAAAALLSMEGSMEKKKGSEKGGFPIGHEPQVGSGQYANLPQDVKMSLYPKPGKSLDGMLDDSMSDIDRISDGSEHQRSKYVSYQK